MVGTAVSTIKHASMERQKLLIIQPLMTDGNAPDGDPLIAIDSVGAGVGERVILTSDGAICPRLASGRRDARTLGGDWN